MKMIEHYIIEKFVIFIEIHDLVKYVYIFYMHKLATRSENQLETRRKNFREIVDILDDLKLDFFLEGGVLLGAIREKDFIKWDWDVEIAFLSDEFTKKFDDVLKRLEESGFTIMNYNNNFHHLKINIYKNDAPDITSFSLFGWSYNRYIKSFVRKDIRIPEKFIFNMKKINFLDRLIYVPTPAKEYLEYKYGDWMTPLKSSEKTVYLTKGHYKKNSFNLALNIDKLIKKLFKN